MKSNEMTKQVTEKLNQLLSDLQMVYQNQRTLHWLIAGPDFHMLHNLFEEYYTETADVIDEVAERILMLGGVPLHTFNDYVQTSKIEAVSNVAKGKDSLKTVVDNYEYLLKTYRELLELSGDNNDEGTSAMLSDLIAGTEKKLWMLKATLA
jgi:starvation-inducible DNA-binding protein